MNTNRTMALALLSASAVMAASGSDGIKNRNRGKYDPTKQPFSNLKQQPPHGTTVVAKMTRQLKRKLEREGKL